ncbi:hypothetical protein CONPUDRAFT_168935 [Coniophora puteana RWD-64-598 SS2]|uniref:VWFA domain-containing protein n=1 Tax=Coniophora puteana (strain RWD-64-598) TaxID=741705 RepID=A0A5M3MAS8_CONPW|nr:uncharacterized protein CONPUDRAFT_168935 [Coniophora puteana RWD-64-598 SS2]EIW76382.1 hypothetical protein CONPUDRAFT_168935 [Coniophora puteana RWD-64-598 SS2]
MNTPAITISTPTSSHSHPESQTSPEPFIGGFINPADLKRSPNDPFHVGPPGSAGPSSPTSPSIPKKPKPPHVLVGSHPYDVLVRYNTVFIVDDSDSVSGTEEADGCWLALKSLAHVANKYDMDGVDVHFVNSKKVGKNLKHTKQLSELFRSVTKKGDCNLGKALQDILSEYVKRLEKAYKEKDLGKRAKLMGSIRPVNYIVITLGEISDEKKLTKAIVSAAKRMDELEISITQMGIQFIQLGEGDRRSEDASIAKYFQKLDDELEGKHRIRDMVDTAYFDYYQHDHSGSLDGLEDDELMKFILGGVNRHLDACASREIDDTPY